MDEKLVTTRVAVMVKAFKNALGRTPSAETLEIMREVAIANIIADSAMRDISR